MSQIAKDIDAILKLGFTPLLKQAGYRKSGRTWHRTEGDFTLIVNVQSSVYNAAGEGRFTVNLGVYSPAVAALAGETPMDKPAERHATVGKRLGVLAYQRDHWWCVRPGVDLALIARDLVDNMNTLGLPWLARHCDIGQIADALKITPSIVSFSAALLGRGEQEAIDRMRRAIVERPLGERRVREWASVQGIAV